jgi:hypothetical protein
MFLTYAFAGDGVVWVTCPPPKKKREEEKENQNKNKNRKDLDKEKEQEKEQEQERGEEDAHIRRAVLRKPDSCPNSPNCECTCTSCSG